ncbi:MAG: PIN domain-containing protein [Rhodanobacteraceae bacterium]|nr:PIN domain-containing protein [Rhodanobacteraceae bacterium]
MSRIQFDTNGLIALPVWVREDHPAIKRIQQGQPAAACALVWYEFVCGPVSDEHKELARAVLAGRIEPVTEAAADLAGRMYNATGRNRRTRTDALIAACAINVGAEFVTLNRGDFAPFEKFGLVLF